MLLYLDSQYFDRQSFASIQEMYMSANNSVVILGDLNARMGDLSKFQKNNSAFKYTENQDTTVNFHSHEIISICEDNNIVPVNHLCTEDVKCEGNLTYR